MMTAARTLLLCLLAASPMTAAPAGDAPVEPDKTYAIWINTDEFHSFQDPAKHPAVPYLLVFRTAERM